MSDYLIAIPSKNRLGGVTADKFFSDFVFFVEPQDLEAYKNYYPNAKIVDIEQNDRGFGYLMNFICDYTIKQGKKYFVFCDDDIFGFRKRNESGKTEKVLNMDIVVDELYTMAEMQGLSQLAISFSGHNRYEKSNLIYGTPARGIHITNAKNMRDVGGVVEYPPIFSDYILSFNFCLYGYKTATTYKYIFEHKMKSKKGGAENIYKSGMMDNYCNYIKGMYGDSITIISKHNQREIRFKFMKQRT